MPDELITLLAQARTVTITPRDQEVQRRSFAYGNTHFENARITREMIDLAADALKADGKKD